MKKKLSIICSGLYLFNAMLHLLLLFGAPLGEYVLGGHYVVIPFHLRILNLLFFILWLSAGISYLINSNILNSKLSLSFIRKFLIAVTTFTSLAFFSNLFLTSSLKEKLLMSPLTFIVSICSILILNRYKDSNN